MIWLPALAVGTVVLALALGGGTRQGLWSDAFVQLSSLPLLAIAANALSARAWPASARWALWLIAVLVLLPIVQLIPLPPSIWTHLPGRARFVASYHEAGMALGWAPLSLDPAATWRSLLSLLPAIAVFLAVLTLDWRSRGVISVAVLVFTVLSVLLGLAQLAGGPDSPLRFYDPTNTGDSVGFFANRNHYAALLYCAIPLAAAWAFALLFEPPTNRRRFGLILILLAYSFILLGLGMAHSRAGVLLAFVAGVASIFMGLGVRRRGHVRRGGRKAVLAVVAANLAGLLLAFQFGFVGTANRFGNDQLLADLRWPMAEVTWRATKANLPLGVGFGAFEPTYQMFETPKVVVGPYVNHAHDDWLELALDGGVPAVAAALAFLAWYGAASLRVWRSDFGRGRLRAGTLARAGTIVVGVLLIHSGLDYPLRTTTLMVVFAFACALMIPPLEPAQRLQGTRLGLLVSF